MPVAIAGFFSAVTSSRRFRPAMVAPEKKKPLPSPVKRRQQERQQFGRATWRFELKDSDILEKNAMSARSFSSVQFLSRAKRQRDDAMFFVAVLALFLSAARSRDHEQRALIGWASSAVRQWLELPGRGRDVVFWPELRHFVVARRREGECYLAFTLLFYSIDI